MTSDPALLEERRRMLRERVQGLRDELGELAAAYRGLPESGLLLDTEGVGALLTPGYCIAGAVEVFDEALIEIDAADDALGRAGDYTGRLRRAAFES
ncbi:hypothetical protein AB0N05_16125 [Nocardia sp. NPDC051030]|uniref:hypothetical protein n=1 Tax=Nocardia sp. NPDC051030 TaxID=3155162 RepID=UPI00342E3FEE